MKHDLYVWLQLLPLRVLLNRKNAVYIERIL